jgi:hypothetical protein
MATAQAATDTWKGTFPMGNLLDECDRTGDRRRRLGRIGDSARRSARLEGGIGTPGEGRGVDYRTDTVGCNERDDRKRGGPAVRPGERSERDTLETQCRVLRGCAGRVAFRPEVLEHMQPGRRLRDDERDQGQEGDQRFAGQDQGSCLSRLSYLE